MTTEPETHRTVCWRCRRPQRVCYCALLPQIPSRTHVVFLQHPREGRVPVGTARMAHLSLPNSEFHQGVLFSDQRLQSAVTRPEVRAAVLFPGPGAQDVASLGTLPDTLVVIDGTWPQARKVLKTNAWLQALPRIAFRPSKPGNYRIRKEPAEHCVSTVEAVAEVLGHLEREPARFAPMLTAFEQMVDWQLDHIARRSGPPRTRDRLSLRPLKPLLPPGLVQNPERAVLFYAEANAFPIREGVEFPPELVQVIAERPATGERVEVLLAPRGELAPHTPRHLELTEELLRAGASAETGRGQWADFLKPDDVLCSWGHFSRTLLTQEQFRAAPFVDLRGCFARLLKARPGDLEQAHQRVDPSVPEPWARGRAGRRLWALRSVFDALAREPYPVRRRRMKSGS